MTKRDDIIEVIAQNTYQAMQWAANNTAKPWVLKGNSIAQDEARQAADRAITSIEALGYTLVPNDPSEGMLTNSGAIEGFNGFAEEGDVDRCHIEWWETMIEQAQKEMEI